MSLSDNSLPNFDRGYSMPSESFICPDHFDNQGIVDFIKSWLF